MTGAKNLAHHMPFPLLVKEDTYPKLIDHFTRINEQKSRLNNMELEGNLACLADAITMHTQIPIIGSTYIDEATGFIEVLDTTFFMLNPRIIKKQFGDDMFKLLRHIVGQRGIVYRKIHESYERIHKSFLENNNRKEKKGPMLLGRI